MNNRRNYLPIPQKDSPLAVWLNYIECLHVNFLDLDLNRIYCIANNLNLLHPAKLVITVGGTNGKGTTCRLLEAIFLSHGLKVGVFSSPHLLCYTERVRINGIELTKAAHSEALAIIETGRDNISLSYFAFSTLSALQLFHQTILDIVILEVGLGGRLDATNIINADIAVITNIALEHTALLGSDRNSIAREKAGIMRYGKPVIIGDPNRPIILDTIAAKCRATLFARNKDWGFMVKEKKYWNWWKKDRELQNLPLPIIPLDNAATALATINCLPFLVSEECIRQSLRNAMLPGRFQIFCQKPLVILDVAHNPHAANYLACQIDALSLPQNCKIRAVIGMLTHKNIPETLTTYLRKKVYIWYCATLQNKYAASAEQLASFLINSKTKKFQDVISAWRQVILDSAPEDCVLVFGSFHTVASIIRTEQRQSILQP